MLNQLTRTTFKIVGEPKGKGRPRMTKNGHTYTPKDTYEYENLVKLAFTQAYPDWVPHKGEVLAYIDAYYSIPKSYSKKKKQLIEAGIIQPTKKPDLDNIAKSILDSLNGIAYLDDSQVIELKVAKYYSDTPCVEVILVHDMEEK